MAYKHRPSIKPRASHQDSDQLNRLFGMSSIDPFLGLVASVTSTDGITAVMGLRRIRPHVPANTEQCSGDIVAYTRY